MTFIQKLDEKYRVRYAAGILSSLQSLIENLGLSIEQTIKALNIPDTEHEEYIKQ